MIRSKKAIVYNSACKTNLKIIDAIANEALKIAFKSAPIESLQVITGEKALELRRMEMQLKYYYKMRSHFKNPDFREVMDTSQYNLFINKRIALPVPLRVLEVKSALQIKRVFIAFLHKLNNVTVPTWARGQIEINMDLAQFRKVTTSEEIYQQLFSELQSEVYSEHKEIFIDGSKTE